MTNVVNGGKTVKLPNETCGVVSSSFLSPVDSALIWYPLSLLFGSRTLLLVACKCVSLSLEGFSKAPVDKTNFNPFTTIQINCCVLAHMLMKFGVLFCKEYEPRARIRAHCLLHSLCQIKKHLCLA